MDKRFTTKRQYEIKQVNNLHEEIIRLVVAGFNNTRIADLLNITPQTVSNVKNSSLGKQKIQKLSNLKDIGTIDVAKRFKELAPKAVDVLEEIMTGELDRPDLTPRDMLRAAIDILDRAGHKPVQVHKVERGVISKYLLEVRQRALEGGFKSENEDSFDITGVEEVAEIVETTNS